LKINQDIIISSSEDSIIQLNQIKPCEKIPNNLEYGIFEEKNLKNFKGGKKFKPF